MAENVADLEALVQQNDLRSLERSMWSACSLGQLELVRRGLELSRSHNYDRLFEVACRFGQLEVAHLLLPFAHPEANDNDAFRQAGSNGHTEVVRFLLTLPTVDPTAGSSMALCTASRCGHVEVVQLLLADGRSDPGADDNYPLRQATYHKHDKIVYLLLRDPRVIEESRRVANTYGCEWIKDRIAEIKTSWLTYLDVERLLSLPPPHLQQRAIIELIVNPQISLS